MSAPKKIKLTDHFRAALKPRDLNQITLKQQQQQHHQNNQQQTKRQQQHQQQSQQQHPDQQQPRRKSQLELLLQGKSNVSFSQQQEQQPRRSNVGPQEQSQSQSQPQQQTLRKIALKPKDQNEGARHPHQVLRWQEPPGIFWEPHYAAESFEYDREQEVRFAAQYRLHRKVDLLTDDHEYAGDDTIAPRRAELVDWLVDIQSRFSLDHEPLYMAVKLADNYLARKFVSSDQHILLFLTSMLIAAKYDERVPPLAISDLIQFSRSKFGVRYSRKQVISLEVDLLNTLNFDIRFPLSYGFLRRFARCTRSDQQTLHLARYILESSMMDNDMIEVLDSKIAAGSLLLAYEMLQQIGAWDETARFYTGYHERDLYPLVHKLNRVVMKLSRKKSAIRRKYSSESFMGVARIPPLLPKALLELTTTATTNHHH